MLPEAALFIGYSYIYKDSEIYYVIFLYSVYWSKIIIIKGVFQDTLSSYSFIKIARQMFKIRYYETIFSSKNTSYFQFYKMREYT